MSEKAGFLDIPKLHMVLFGIWPPDLIADTSRRKFYTGYKHFIAVFYYIFAASLTTELGRLIVLNKPSERVAGSAALVVTVLMLCFKSVIYQKNKIPNMCLSFLEVEADVWESNDEDVQNTYKTAHKWCGYLNAGVMISSHFTVWSFTIFFFFQMHRIGIFEWNFDNVSFMYELYFPFNKTEHFTYVAVFNVYAAMLGIVLNVACQSTFYSLIIFTAMRFRILQIRVKKFHSFATKFDGNIETTIKYFIGVHQELSSFVTTLNESTKYVMLMEFLLNSVNVASVLVQIITMHSLLELAFPVFYFSLLIMQVFVLGWTCNEIKLQSLGIADAIYESSWNEQSDTAKKLLKFMIMRAQKPLMLTIGPFSPMTTETALLTMKAAYSYVTLMMKGYDK